MNPPETPVTSGSIFIAPREVYDLMIEIKGRLDGELWKMKAQLAAQWAVQAVIVAWIVVQVSK